MVVTVKLYVIAYGISSALTLLIQQNPSAPVTQTSKRTFDMPKGTYSARLRKKIFDLYEVTMLTTEDGRMSSYCGGRINPPVPCVLNKGEVYQVKLNDTWWIVDATDWMLI